VAGTERQEEWKTKIKNKDKLWWREYFLGLITTDWFSNKGNFLVLEMINITLL